MARLTPIGLAQSGSAAPTVAPNYDIIRPRPHAGSVDVVVFIGDATDGHIIGQAQASVEAVTWLLSDYGRLDMTLSGDDPMARWLRFGMRVAVSLGSKLPVWGGVIDEPTTYVGGQVRVSAYGPLHVLRTRLSGINDVATDITPGAAMRRLWRMAEVSAPLPMTLVVSNDNDDEHVSFTANLEPIYSVMQKTLAGVLEYQTYTRVADGRIEFLVLAADTLGRDLRDKRALVDGINMQPVELTVQGPLVNQWFVAGKGEIWEDDGSGKAVREVEDAVDETSSELYGLRQAPMVVEETNASALERLAETRLRATAQPYRAFNVMAADAPPARFGQYEVGDIIRVELYPPAGEASVHHKRVLGLTYLPKRGTCELVLGDPE